MTEKKISANLVWKKWGLWLCSLVFISACGSSNSVTYYTPETANLKQPKNIILMIGDGMGLTQVSAALYSNKRPLNLERFQHIGFHKSYAAGELITDSAAGATAFACGIKTYNGAIGVNVDSIPQRNIIEEAEEKGLATGLVATAFIVHATPAAFFAHQPIRVFHENIAADLLKLDIDLLIGGGKKYFDRRETDDRNLYKELRQKGYVVSDFLTKELQQLSFKPTHKIIHFTADRHPVPVTAGRNYLPFASRVAPKFLKGMGGENGFFLMIEGSQIDWAGHGNEGDLMIAETLDFDRAIGEVLNFAEADGNTLVIVTADHETGGMAINPGSKFGNLKTAFTTNGHTASLVPVYAFGPGAEEFKGIYENTAIYHKMRKLLNFDNRAAVSQVNAGQ
jgi:alkaline phosphatase